jgi:uncharacterized protein
MSFLTNERHSPVIIAIGGPAGAGKTTIARILAPTFAHDSQAEWINTDAVRKQLADVPWSVRLAAEHYTNEARDAVYSEVFTRASCALLDGRSVIVDAGFGRAKDRRFVEDFARIHARHFLGLMFHASLDTRCSRAALRFTDPSLLSPSDADEQYIRTCERFEPLEPKEQTWRILDMDGTISTAVTAARDMIRGFLASNNSPSTTLMQSDPTVVLGIAARC